MTLRHFLGRYRKINDTVTSSLLPGIIFWNNLALKVVTHCPSIHFSMTNNLMRGISKEATMFSLLNLYFFYTIVYVNCQILQLKETKRTATIADPPPAAAAERGKGGAETGTDAAEIAVETVRSAGTDAG